MKTLEILPTPIDKNLPIPYYYQIVGAIREAIEEGNFQDGDEAIALPSEAELGGLFMVNRGTIRHALQVLENEGLIRKEKGKGSFVRRQRLKMNLARLESTTEDIERRGWRPSTRLLSIEKSAPSEHVRSVLNLDAGELVWVLTRTRKANGEPISLQQSMIPVAIMPDLDNKNLEGSLYGVWREAYQIVPQRGGQTIRTRLPLEDEMRVLKISASNPVFEITRVTYDARDKAIEFLKSIWRGDRYDFFINLSNNS